MDQIWWSSQWQLATQTTLLVSTRTRRKVKELSWIGGPFEQLKALRKLGVLFLQARSNKNEPTNCRVCLLVDTRSRRL